MDISKYGRGAATSGIAKWRAEGKKAFGIVCCNVPFEILHAAGVFPVRLRSTGCTDYSSGEAFLGDKSCGFTKALLQRLMDGTYELDGLVASNSCMVASGIFSNWKSQSQKSNKEQFLYELDVPHMCNDASANYFSWDLEDLQTALQEYTGTPITNEMLKQSVDTYNEARRLVKRVYDLHTADCPVVSGEESLRLTLAATEMPIEEYIELLKEYLAEAEQRKPLDKRPIRIMIAGSALDDPEYVKAIEDCGFVVVADMNCFGLRFLRDEIPYDENNVMGSLSAYYLNRSSCPRMMDGSDVLHEFILDEIKKYSVQGVIIERLSFCDKWANETAVLADVLEKLDIPTLQLERSTDMSAKGQFGIRVEAFREMLEIR